MTAESATRSYIVRWKDAEGGMHANQVYAQDRDEAIWRIALLMQTPNPHRIRFVSCDEGRRV